MILVDFQIVRICSFLDEFFGDFDFHFDRGFFNKSGFIPGILGFHVIGAASILVEHVWADRAVSRKAMARFLAF